MFSKSRNDLEANVDENSCFIDGAKIEDVGNHQEAHEMQTLKCKADDLRSLASNFLPSTLSRKSRLKAGE